MPSSQAAIHSTPRRNPRQNLPIEARHNARLPGKLCGGDAATGGCSGGRMVHAMRLKPLFVSFGVIAVFAGSVATGADATGAMRGRSASVVARPEAVARSRGVPSVGSGGGPCNDAVVRPAATTPAISNPIVGDFNGDGRDDILSYGLNLAPDSLWYGKATGFAAGPAIHVDNRYGPAVGDFNGDGRDDVLWLGRMFPPTASYLWYGNASGAPFTAKSVTLPEGDWPLAGSLNLDGKTD